MYIAVKEFGYENKQVKPGDIVENPSSKTIELGLVKYVEDELLTEVTSDVSVVIEEDGEILTNKRYKNKKNKYL